MQYTRTAERETSLIRPLPVLQITVDYLLNLLDQPYDDSFLSIYNFLWDRMRAVRLDLRMQHIFNQEAITMLEQMVYPRLQLLKFIHGYITKTTPVLAALKSYSILHFAFVSNQIGPKIQDNVGFRCNMEKK